MYVDIEAAKVPSARATAGTRRRRIRLIMLGYILVAPAVIWRLAVAIYPFLNTIWQSFTNNSPLAGTQRFIGLANFTRMFQDPVILQSLSFTFIFTAVSTAVQLVYAMGIALLLNKAFRGRGIVRAVNLLPWAMPAIVVATASQWMFNSQFGMIDDLIARVLPFRPIFSMYGKIRPGPRSSSWLDCKISRANSTKPRASMALQPGAPSTRLCCPCWRR